MKTMKIILIFVLILTLGAAAAMAETRIEKLESLINFQMFSGEPPVTMASKVYFMNQGYTEAEWEQACANAISRQSKELFDSLGWEDDPTTLRGYTGDLGDESMPLYAMCSLAALAGAGLILARKKRAAC